MSEKDQICLLVEGSPQDKDKKRLECNHVSWHTVWLWGCYPADAILENQSLPFSSLQCEAWCWRRSVSWNPGDSWRPMHSSWIWNSGRMKSSGSFLGILGWKRVLSVPRTRNWWPNISQGLETWWRRLVSVQVVQYHQIRKSKYIAFFSFPPQKKKGKTTAYERWHGCITRWDHLVGWWDQLIKEQAIQPVKGNERKLENTLRVSGLSEHLSCRNMFLFLT